MIFPFLIKNRLRQGAIIFFTVILNCYWSLILGLFLFFNLRGTSAATSLGPFSVLFSEPNQMLIFTCILLWLVGLLGIGTGFVSIRKHVAGRDQAEKKLFSLNQKLEQRVNEQLHLEDQLRQSQKMEAIGVLACGVAHDFNNILMAITGFTELTIEQLPVSNDTAHSNLQQVLVASDRAKDLILQILFFKNGPEQELQTVQFHLIVKEVLKLIRATIPSNIEISQHIDANCGNVMGDPTQLHQIMMNLCTNASHAIRNGKGIIEVTLKSLKITPDNLSLNFDLEPGSYIHLTVADTGHGIDKDDLGKIFTPYFTTKQPGEGTGLGLSVVYGIVKRHSGHIRVVSHSGTGSIFHIYLPKINEPPAIG